MSTKPENRKTPIRPPVKEGEFDRYKQKSYTPSGKPKGRPRKHPLKTEEEKAVEHNDKIVANIQKQIKRHPDEIMFYEDYFTMIRDLDDHQLSKELRNDVVRQIPISEYQEAFFNLFKKLLLFDSKTYFDCFLQYIEFERDPKERFYIPRRNKLLPIINGLQDLADNKLDELFISQPPRTGKTSIVMFFMCWILGKYPEKSNLYSAYSDTITKAFYNGILETLNDPTTYLWNNVFPEQKIVQTNSQEEIINIDRKKRYPSLTCRSLYGTLNGACDCNGFLISDDLIGGIEEALNKDRLVSAWSKVDNNLLPRAKENAKVVWIGTRWSLTDPIGLRQELLENDERFKGRRFKIINLPALNEEDESNFEYKFGVGFSSEYYRQRRASFERNNDIASWNAQYMGQPIERDGSVFMPEDFRYYNGELPSGTPDRVFMAVDPAFGGGDFVASPVCFMYGDDIYVHDVVYSNADKSITQPLLARAIQKYGVTAMQIEANKSTEAYKEGVESELKKNKIRINLTTKPAPTDKGKNQRIFDKAPDIREFMIFREDGKRTKEYSLFMQNVFSFSMFGKNKNDDAPDSLSMAMDMCKVNTKPVIFKRPF